MQNRFNKDVFLSVEKMIIMKKILYILLVLFLAAFIYGAKYLMDRAPIFTGYSAKYVASYHYLSGRSQADIEHHDLTFFPVNLAKNVINKKEKSVTGTFLGMAAEKAVYHQGLGFTLIADGSEAKIKKMTTQVKPLPEDPDTIFWPTGDKMYDTIPPVVNMKKLRAAIDSAFNKGNTRAVVVAYDTLFMREKYASGFTKNTRILGWSMTKSITSALVGILSKQGKLHVHQRAPISEWKKDKRSKITLNDLLHQSSGLEWVEDYGDISDATIMLYQKGNMAEYALNKPAEYPPDSVWYYSSGTTNIISEIIRRTIGNNQQYWDFPRTALFNKIGMRSAIIETDAAGNFVGSSYTFATPRDWARFGLLYLKDGLWGTKRILPEGWVKYTTTPARKSGGEYGVQFWLNRSKKEIPDGPASIFFCDGFQGQRVYVIPSKDLVIVRMGLNGHGEFDYNQFVMSILAAFK